MSVLWKKNWRYEIALDSDILGDVTKFASEIKDRKAHKAFDFEIKFFKKYFSIDQVISRIQLISTDRELDEFTKTIKRNYTNLLHIPHQLEGYYRDIIAKLDPTMRELVEMVLSLGLKSTVVPPIKSYYKAILGKFYGKTIKKCKHYASSNKRNLPNRIIEEYEVKSLLDGLQKKIATSISDLNLWGRDHEMDYTLKFNNSYGFGKFRSEVTSNLNNTFTVNCPDNKMPENDLYMQYLTNVYPGYGHFVAREFQNLGNRAIDFGANFIFNGWSTFSAWHIFPSLYIKNLKVENCRIVSSIMSCKKPSDYDKLYQLLLNTYDKSIAIKLLKQISQYPAKFESRILGALATEIVIDSGYAINPNNYLERLKLSNITNYFTNLSKLK